MKNEALARAISELDDDLIADAHTAVRKVRFPARRFCAMAACMLLFFGTLLYVGFPDGTMLLDGSPLSDTPVVVQDAAPVAHTAEPYMRDGSILTVLLDLDLRDATRITAENGTFELMRGSRTLYAGSDRIASGPLTLLWSVRAPDPGETYQLTVGETTLTLSFDSATACWVMQKNRNSINP